MGTLQAAEEGRETSACPTTGRWELGIYLGVTHALRFGVSFCSGGTYCPPGVGGTWKSPGTCPSGRSITTRHSVGQGWGATVDSLSCPNVTSTLPRGAILPEGDGHMPAKDESLFSRLRPHGR